MQSLLQKDDNGFTLIEILISFFIMSIALTVLFNGFSTNLQDVKTSENYNEAVLIAKSRLAVVGFEVPLIIGDYSGDVQQYQWHIRITPHEMHEIFLERQTFSMFQVDVMVQWIDQGQKEQFISITTYKLGKIA